jgi:hypothetical protein
MINIKIGMGMGMGMGIVMGMFIFLLKWYGYHNVMRYISNYSIIL